MPARAPSAEAASHAVTVRQSTFPYRTSDGPDILDAEREGRRRWRAPCLCGL